MTSKASTSPTDWQAQARAEISRLVALGQLDEALKLCDQALDRANRAGDRDSCDRAFCNRASVLIFRGGGSAILSGLQQILMRSTNLQNRFSASYIISQHYYGVPETQKSLFYARQALRYAKELDDPEAQVRAYNAIGNPLLVDSYFAEALESYEEALVCHARGESLDRALILSNIGYCLVVTGSLTSGYRNLANSLRMMRRLGVETWQHAPHLGLSYACMEVQRYQRAKVHALRGLELAEASGLSTGIKNALYLLGEAEKNCGHLNRAFERFHQLQTRFYPENPMVIDILMSVDVRKMINLMA